MLSACLDQRQITRGRELASELLETVLDHPRELSEAESMLSVNALLWLMRHDGLDAETEPLLNRVIETQEQAQYILRRLLAVLADMERLGCNHG